MHDPLPAAWRFEAIGTSWRIDTPAELTEVQRATVTARIDEFDRAWSRFRDDSLVSRIAREPGHHRLPADAPPLLDWYRELYEGTAGQLSPLVGRALETLGYDASYRLTPLAVRERVPTWQDALARDGTHLDTVGPVMLDVGAAGKGYLVDLVGEVLNDLGVTTSIVDAGGDLRARGDATLRVALEHPRDATKAIGVVELHQGALCASASNRRAWGDGLHHVLDALTGEPTSAVIATWVLHADALHADGLATALFFGHSGSQLAGRHAAPYLRMYANGRVESSPDFPGEVFR
ncbi:MAG TPA: FAD:protein FMN transferase [Pseudolysinimonas sp.]|nr:FAD:protein FMN transferase [Pseudolysinimonas sp.]